MPDGAGKGLDDASKSVKQLMDKTPAPSRAQRASWLRPPPRSTRTMWASSC